MIGQFFDCSIMWLKVVITTQQNLSAGNWKANTSFSNHLQSAIRGALELKQLFSQDSLWIQTLFSRYSNAIQLLSLAETKCSFFFCYWVFWLHPHPEEGTLRYFLACYWLQHFSTINLFEVSCKPHDAYNISHKKYPVNAIPNYVYE